MHIFKSQIFFIRGITHCRVQLTQTLLLITSNECDIPEDGWISTEGAIQSHDLHWLANERKAGVELLVFLPPIRTTRDYYLDCPTNHIKQFLPFDVYEMRPLVKRSYWLANQGSEIQICTSKKAGVKRTEEMIEMISPLEDKHYTCCMTMVPYSVKVLFSMPLHYLW